MDNKTALSLLHKILKSKDKNFALLDESFTPIKFVSISKIKDFVNEKEWRGEDEAGNSIVMLVTDTYLYLGAGENEFSARSSLKKVAYFNFDDVKIEHIEHYVGIKFPDFYAE